MVDLCPAPDWLSNGITMLVIIGGNIVFHSLFVIVSNYKSEKYFKQDSLKKEKEIEKEEQSRLLNK